MRFSAYLLDRISFVGTLGQRQFQILSLIYTLLAASFATLGFSFRWADFGVAMAVYLFAVAVVKRLRDGGSPVVLAFLLCLPLFGWGILAYYLSLDSAVVQVPSRAGKRVLGALAAFAFMSIMAVPVTAVVINREYQVEQPAPISPLADSSIPRISPDSTEQVNTQTDGESHIPEIVNDEPEFASASLVLLQRLESLAVEPEHSNGYNRDLFTHWVDEDGDGCDTRREVLIEESQIPVTLGPGCAIENGSWFSPYDGTTTTDSSDFDVDHVVAVKEAWESGAWRWNKKTRTEFANDLANAESLIAVSASSNRSKSASDPSGWLPTELPYRCTYAASWVSIKHTWNLSVDALELESLRKILEQC